MEAKQVCNTFCNVDKRKQINFYFTLKREALLNQKLSAAKQTDMDDIQNTKIKIKA